MLLFFLVNVAAFFLDFSKPTNPIKWLKKKMSLPRTTFNYLMYLLLLLCAKVLKCIYDTTDRGRRRKEKRLIVKCLMAFMLNIVCDGPYSFSKNISIV